MSLHGVIMTINYDIIPWFKLNFKFGTLFELLLFESFINNFNKNNKGEIKWNL